ncbi:aspartate kinase [Aquabacterium sp.]|uniref:amino acid kinase family protein n=1 Tax=Aquabacterium sp. TaxID=1872578 RepID=UPI002C688E62|nr:aspartate kinase [Aquabacterium sp.]HSW08759.1 aspartate kinase [Aquabacterium sp.]
MWIVKLGGSLCADPVLVEWLDLLAQLGGGRVTVVCGGGSFADEVRRVQAHWQFNDLAAHNMALLAMAQVAYQLHALNPTLRLTTSKTDIRRVLQKGQPALWQPFELQRDQPDAQTNWEVTSDSIALDLARRLNAERLVIVKSCAIDPQQTLPQLCEAGVVDRRFGALSEHAPFPIEFLHKTELERMRALLLGDVRQLG